MFRTNPNAISSADAMLETPPLHYPITDVLPTVGSCMHNFDVYLQKKYGISYVCVLRSFVHVNAVCSSIWVGGYRKWILPIMLCAVKCGHGGVDGVWDVDWIERGFVISLVWSAVVSRLMQPAWNALGPFVLLRSF